MSRDSAYVLDWKEKKRISPTICYSPRTRNRDQVLPSSNHFGQILEYSSVNFAEILQLLLVLIAHRLFASVCCIFIYLTLILYFFTFSKTFNSVECMHFLSLFVFPQVLQLTNVRTGSFLNTIHHVFFNDIYASILNSWSTLSFFTELSNIFIKSLIVGTQPTDWIFLVFKQYIYWQVQNYLSQK